MFTWTSEEGESFDMGDEEWDISTGKTPRMFLEIDDAGEARLKSWSSERVLDIEELWLDGEALVFDADGLDGAKRLDTRTLRERPD